jgi:hypothetical protein
VRHSAYSASERETSAKFGADQSEGQPLYYHLRNAINLTLRTREAIIRMLRGKPVDVEDSG